MSSSRWSYKTAIVTVEGNKQEVRELTAGERATFAATSAKVKANEMQASDVPSLIVGMGCQNPKLTAEEIAAMPPALLDACVEKIMELTGLRDRKDEEGTGEKKAATSS